MTRTLVGRKEELSRLADLLDTEMAVVVTGPAGIGKSTLVAHATASNQRSTLVGAASIWQFATPYLSLANALGREALHGDPHEVTAQVKSALVGSILVIEDLQWIDAATLAVLEKLRGTAPLVVTARDDSLTGDRHKQRLVGGGFVEMPLEGLSEQDATELLCRAGVFDQSREDMAAAIRSAKGNPLLLLAMAAEPGLRTTSRAVINSQVLRLSATARMLLARLAVEDDIGSLPLPSRRFTKDHPGSSPDGKGTTEPWTELLASGMVRECGSRVVIDHQLFGEAALASLATSELTSLHLDCAETSRTPAIAAHHLMHAGESARAFALARRLAEDTKSDFERAVLLSLAAEAGMNAAGLEAHEQVGVCLEAAEAFQSIGEMRHAEAIVGNLSPDEPDLFAQVTLARSKALLDWDPEVLRGQIHVAIARLRSSGVGHPYLEIQLVILLSRLIARVDLDVLLAETLAEEALQLANQHQTCRGLATGMVGSARMLKGDPDASSWFHRALALAEEEQDEHAFFHVSTSLGLDRFLNGDWAVALEVYERALSRARNSRRTGWQRELQFYIARIRAMGTAELQAAAECCPPRWMSTTATRCLRTS